MASLSRTRLTLLTVLLAWLCLIQLPLPSSGACTTPPVITLAQYNSVKAGATVTQMQQLLGGLGNLQSTEYFNAYTASNSLTYYYRGSNLILLVGTGNVNTYSYASFAFNPTTQQLTYKTQYGLC